MSKSTTQNNTRAPSIIDDVASESPARLARVVLKRGKSSMFVRGSPMVYSGAIDRVVGRPPPETGDTVIVQDHNEATIGWGVFNAVSMFRVRIMQLHTEAKSNDDSVLDMESLIPTRIFQSAALRAMIGLPSEGTNVYRLVNSEGDRLSGLVVDVLGRYAVVASSAAWVERYRPQITTAVKEALPGCAGVIWRPSADMLKEEGCQLSEFADGEAPETEEVKVVENGVLYFASLTGQKTGFYADQRDSRKFLRSFCEGKSVLDLCSYSGGFSLNAAMAGAVNVTGVDSSGAAIELASRNTELNGIDVARCRFVKADVIDFMQAAIASKDQSWDIVILDPPKLAPNKKVLERASARYRKLNSLAMRLVKPGGLLMTCSCSGAVAQSGVFPSILQESASMAGKKIRVIRSGGAAPDHPLDLSYPEGQYLSNVLLHVL